MTAKIIAQIIGFIAVGSSLVVYSQKKRRYLLLAKTAQDVAWLLHYLLLGCLTPAVTSGVNITRSLVFVSSDGKKEAKSRIWLPVYIAVYIACAPLTWKNAFSVLPVAASVISTVCFYVRDIRVTKILAIAASSVTLSYNIFVSHSLSVYIGASITIVTALVSLISGRIGAQKKAAEAKNH